MKSTSSDPWVAVGSIATATAVVVSILTWLTGAASEQDADIGYISLVPSDSAPASSPTSAEIPSREPPTGSLYEAFNDRSLVLGPQEDPERTQCIPMQIDFDRDLWADEIYTRYAATPEAGDDLTWDPCAPGGGWSDQVVLKVVNNAQASLVAPPYRTVENCERAIFEAGIIFTQVSIDAVEPGSTGHDSSISYCVWTTWGRLAFANVTEVMPKQDVDLTLTTALSVDLYHWS